MKLYQLYFNTNTFVWTGFILSGDSFVKTSIDEFAARDLVIRNKHKKTIDTNGIICYEFF